MTINVTENAALHITAYLNKRQSGLGIRVGVKTSGCSGLAYKLEFVDKIAADDVVYDIKNVKIFIDNKSLKFLKGMTLDYETQGINGGFKFINPNVESQCGCGESFTVKE